MRKNMSDLNKYKSMENTLQAINTHYVQLSPEEIRRNNEIMDKIIWGIVKRMKQNIIFDTLFCTIFYGGSYYDGLKVGHPDEYDIDLLLVLPKSFKAEVARSTSPGYVHATLGNKGNLAPFCESGTNYLDTKKILSWIQGLLDIALIDFNYETEHTVHIQTRRKAGPAFTLLIRGEIAGVHVFMDIDLVTCFLFTKDSWPQGGYRQNPCRDAGSFFIVPKSPKSDKYSGRYWRLSFQAQERNLIHGQEKLKPALKLLKKLRNTQNQPIDSYHLKTIVLWEVLQNPQNVSADKSLSYVFMHILKLYRDKMKKKEIQYFWNKKLNLIENLNDYTYQCIGGFLDRIIKRIDKTPFEIVQYILEPHELANFEVFPARQALLEPEEPQPESACIIL